MTTDDREAIDQTRRPAVDAGATIVLERIGAQARITISRIDKHNALSRDTLAALAAAVGSANADGAVHYLVIRGAGTRYFAAGGDLVDLAAIRSDADTAAFAARSRGALDAVRDSAVPTIAFINGDAIGGGAELALACDLRVMASTARLGYVQSRLAITSAWGGGPDLCGAVGPARALRMMARAEMVSASDALAWGLCEAVFDDGLDGAAANAFFAPLEATERHVLVALKDNVAACRLRGAYDDARAVEHRNLVSTWTHAAHWSAVDRIMARPRGAAR